MVLDNISVSKEISVLEIGVGAGSTAELIVGKVKEFELVPLVVEVGSDFG